MRTTILNSPILTGYGSYDYEPINIDEAKSLIKDGFNSAVGHQSTCDVLSTLLEVNVPLNRVQYTQQDGETALIFKLKSRPEEGRILTASEIEAVGYEFGLLRRQDCALIVPCKSKEGATLDANVASTYMGWGIEEVFDDKNRRITLRKGDKDIITYSY